MEKRISSEFAKLSLLLLVAALASVAILGAVTGWRSTVDAPFAVSADGANRLGIVPEWVKDKVMGCGLAALAGSLRRRRALLADLAIGLLRSAWNVKPAATAASRCQPLTLPRELFDTDRTRVSTLIAAGSNKLATGTRNESASA